MLCCQTFFINFLAGFAANIALKVVKSGNGNLLKELLDSLDQLVKNPGQYKWVGDFTHSDKKSLNLLKIQYQRLILAGKTKSERN